MGAIMITTLKRVTAGATVTLTIEVSGCGSWGQGTELSQVYNQAAQVAVEYIKSRCEKDGRIRIVGEPQVRSVLTSEER
jgi:hypothetical protein